MNSRSIPIPIVMMFVGYVGLMILIVVMAIRNSQQPDPCRIFDLEGGTNPETSDVAHCATGDAVEIRTIGDRPMLLCSCSGL